ncbi:fungal hydrophobin [Imleria badia]|nr:fungal hydrophobin [Imleria badia]
MFIRATTVLFSVVALAGVATALPNALEVRQVSECNTGSIQCCSSTIDSSTTFIDELFGYLGLPPPAGGTQVGFTCSPITVGGSGSGSTCVSQPVCCNGNVFNGISTGCSPITINE